MVNIFFTDWNPLVAARDSCDSYVVKIPVEVAMLLSAIHWRKGYDGPAFAPSLVRGVSSGDILKFENGTVLPAVGPYQDSRVIKSSSETYQWLIKSTGNYGYALSYGLELIEEYKRRYGKMHQTEGVLLWLQRYIPNIPRGPLTTDVGLAMPDVYKNRADPTKSYKMYLIYDKQGVLKWNYGKMPEWYKNKLQ